MIIKRKRIIDQTCQDLYYSSNLWHAGEQINSDLERKVFDDTVTVFARFIFAIKDEIRKDYNS